MEVSPMPIYEFKCEDCGEKFEELIFNDSSPVCPACGSAKTEKMLSVCARRYRGADSSSEYSSAAPSGGGCAGCSGGNCAGCGH